MQSFGKPQIQTLRSRHRTSALGRDGNAALVLNRGGLLRDLVLYVRMGYPALHSWEKR